MKSVLTLAAAAEVATGVALLAVPSLVARLLLGEGLSGVGLVVGRAAGIALVALGVACWPGPPRIGMLSYGAAMTVLLAYVGITGGGGVLLWPAVALHAVITIILLRPAARD